MGYAPYQAYPNHPLSYLAINYITPSPCSCSPPTRLENLQLMDCMPDPIQSIPNLQLDNSNGSQGQKSSPKQFHFDLIPNSYKKLLPLLIQIELVVPTLIKPLTPPYL